MSRLFAILGAPGTADDLPVRRMVAASQAEAAERKQCWAGQGGVVGVSRSEWELGPDFADQVLVLEQGSIVLAADASLYYRDELRKSLRSLGVRAEGDSPSHLIAAAYQAWGTSLVDVLEGDYAFVLWDSRRRLVFAARDFAGTRPLYFSRAGDRMILASRLTAVTAHPGVSRELNRFALAEDLIGASSMAVSETIYSAVETLPAGWRLVWQPGTAPRLDRFWEPPAFEGGDGPGPEEAAEQLRAVLRGAVRERLAVQGPTAVWTSGGYDSPAVFALAHGIARHAGRPEVVPVSMSYPEGDPGREDPLIEAVGRHVGTEIHWVRVDDVPGFPEPGGWAGRRDQPFAHPYEEWNRSLTQGARQVGARVILGGNGGDQFFSVSPVFLADLARSGQWSTLMQEARALGFGRRSFRDLFHWAVQPALPGSLLQLAQLVRGGRPLRPHLVSPVPTWMGLDRQTAAVLWQRQWHYGVRRPNESLGAAETSWYLNSSFGPRICAAVFEIVRGSGAEARSPLYDRRVLEFMARRPREDRFAGGQNKRLLRRAMSGLLPPELLGPRSRRTGLPSRYLQRTRREALPGWLAALGPRPRVEELGLLAPGALAAAAQQYLANSRWEGTLGGELFNVFSVEFWLRARADSPSEVAKVA